MPDINKVEMGGQTLIDLTEDTVDENSVLQGRTFHKANGSVGEGKVVVADVIDNLESTSADDALSANQGRVLKEAIDNKKSMFQGTTAEIYQAIRDGVLKEGDPFMITDDYSDVIGNMGDIALIGNGKIANSIKVTYDKAIQNSNDITELKTLTIEGVSLGSHTFSANGVWDVNISPTQHFSKAIVVLDLIYSNPSKGAQFLSHRRYQGGNQFRIMSTTDQSVNVTALILTYI